MSCIANHLVVHPRGLALGLALVLAPSLSTIPSQSQTRPTPAPQSRSTFEVASIRLNPSTECCTTFTLTYPANRFTASGITLELLTSIAYGTGHNRIIGGPSWFDLQRYDISAKVEGDVGITREQMQPLIQNLLEQRFHLVAHRQQKLVPGYALVVAKDGFKLKPNTNKSEVQPHSQVLANELQGWNIPASTLAFLLEIPAGDPVVDKTGITGNYDIKLSYTTAGFPNSNLPDLFTAVQEQFGLKLVPQKVPVDTLVIDQVDKTPTEN
jgi:uncharacterized protein (TIGR03435 family)